MSDGRRSRSTSRPANPPGNTWKRARSVSNPRDEAVSQPGKKPKSDPDPRRSEIRAVSFGIEIETILAFHEELLRKVLKNEGIDAKIVKSIPDRHHCVLLGQDLPEDQQSVAHKFRDRYPSWVLDVPIDDVTFRRQRMILLRVPSSESGRFLRPYLMEPLLLARKLLGKADLPCSVIGAIEPVPGDPQGSNIPYPNSGGDEGELCLLDSVVDYSTWTLTDDHTVIGALPSQLAKVLTQRGISDCKSWDSHGIEIISPVFDLDKKDPAILQVQQYLDALRNGSQYDIVDSVWTSVHVHIGFDIKKAEDVPVCLFQHIAYILILHEDLISQCHPRSRCGIKTKPGGRAIQDADRPLNGENDLDESQDVYITPADPSPKELEVENDLKVRSYEKKYTGYDNVSSNARYMASSNSVSYPMPERAIRDLIFHENGSALDLIRLMQKPKDNKDPNGGRHRGYMVNWCNIENLIRGETTWKPIKPTIEFRQHACTTDAQVIRYWVIFLEAIVNLAYKMCNLAVTQVTEYAEFEAGKYHRCDTKAWPSTDMTLFCLDFLHLDEEEAAYWQGRYNRYKDDRP